MMIANALMQWLTWSANFFYFLVGQPMYLLNWWSKLVEFNKFKIFDRWWRILESVVWEGKMEGDVGEWTPPNNECRHGIYFCTNRDRWIFIFTTAIYRFARVRWGYDTWHHIVVFLDNRVAPFLLFTCREFRMIKRNVKIWYYLW